MSDRLVSQPGTGAAVRPRSVLLVEDDEALSHGIRFALEKDELEVVTAASCGSAKIYLAERKYDLILLDVGLPDGTGFELCCQIRQTSTTPVIFLTARDEEVNVVMGLEMGADDYITKPFRVTELLARIKAVFRRTTEGGSEAEKQYGDIVIDVNSGRVRRDGQLLHLTATEYRLLVCLSSNPGQIVPRDRLLELLWDSEGRFVDSNTLSVYVHRLREKLEKQPNKPSHLATIRGLGYRWN